MKSFKFFTVLALLSACSLATMAQKEDKNANTAQNKPATVVTDAPKPGDPMAQVKMMYISVTAVTNVKGVCSDILLNVGLDENVPEGVGKKLPELVKRAKNNVITFLDAMNNAGFKVISVTSEKDGDTVYTHYLLYQTNPNPGK
jgi:hypothetical protein